MFFEDMKAKKNVARGSDMEGLKPKVWQLLFGLFLLLLSAALYLLHYLIFRDLHHLTIFGMSEIAFLPLEVLFVTMILHELLDTRDKRDRLLKLNMLIGLFFSEIGTRLLFVLSCADPKQDDIRHKLVIKEDWTEKEFKQICEDLKKHDFTLSRDLVDMEKTKAILDSDRDLLVRLLENPSMLEHEAFTELLRSVFHLREELDYRKDISGLPANDMEHLVVDCERVYQRMVPEWIEYMKYLKRFHPYFFMLALRTNPFDADASVVIR